MSLLNKKIVLCRRPEQAGELVSGLKARGAEPVVFQTFTLELLPLQSSVKSEIFQLNRHDYLILGSENGVRFFSQIVARLLLPVQLRLAVVGGKTAAACAALWHDMPVQFQANSLQQLLEKIAGHHGSESVSVLNPTSLQSLQNIHLNIPQNILLKRLPVYQSIPYRRHSPEIINRIRNEKFEAFFFGSPSSFDAFIKLVGRTPLQSEAAICTPGKTTASQIEKRGIAVPIIPEAPDTLSILKAMEKHFATLSDNQFLSRKKWKKYV